MRLLFLLCASLSAFARADLQGEANACIALRSRLQVTGTHVLTEPLRITDPNNLENTQLVIEGTGASCQIEGWIEGPLVILDNPRRCEMRSLNIVNHVGDGVLVKAFPTPGHVGSAGNNSFYNVCVQAKGFAWKVEATDGSDFSASSWFNCDVSSGEVGFKFVGSNNLNPHFFNVTGSFLGLMYDFSEGGACHNIVGGGPSHCAVGILSNYEGTVSSWVVEDSGIALKLTAGVGAYYDFGVTHVRSTKTLVESASNGKLTVSCLAVFDNPRITMTGDAGYLNLSRNAAFVKVSKPSGSKLTVEKSMVGFVPVK